MREEHDFKFHSKTSEQLFKRTTNWLRIDVKPFIMNEQSDKDNEEPIPPSGLCPSKCIIHCVQEPSNNKLISPKDMLSWQTLLNAAKIRGHKAILDIADAFPENSFPQDCVYYHRDCRIMFTMKRDLEVIKSSNELLLQADVQAGTSASSERQTRKQTGLQSPSSSRVYSPVCLICQKTGKYKKGSHSREGLVKCGDLRADETLRNKAIENNDSRMIALLSRELVAAEGHYHRSCYRSYTRQVKQNNEDIESYEFNEEDLRNQFYTNAEKTAYAEIYKEIRDLFCVPKVVKLSELRESMKTHMRTGGVSELRESTRTHMLRKIKTEFKDSLNYTKDSQNNVLIYPDNLTTEQLVKENQDLKSEINYLLAKNVNTKDESINVALKLRQSIQEQDSNESWPPLPSDLTNANEYIPKDLLNFLKVLLTGKPGNTDKSGKTSRVASSIGQDIVYIVTNCRIKPPKHILLPFAVKTLTGNVELVKILNRLGHGISYDQIQEIDTALCLDKLSRYQDTVPLPECIHQSVPTTLAWDNIDRLEETLSGKETSHRVNGIAVQKKTYGPFLPITQGCHVVKSKKRSITPILPTIPEYNAGERVGPPSRKYIALNETEVIDECLRKDLLWMLSRLHCSSNQTISSWTGFNILTRDNVQIETDNIGYMPTINSPATQLKTVHELCAAESEEVLHSITSNRGSQQTGSTTMENFQETEFKVSEINKKNIGKVIVKFCGNEGQGDETGLRRLLQAVIDHIPKERDPSVWRNAEIEMYDWNYRRFVITSGRGECKFFVNYDKSGSPHVMRETRGTFFQLVKSFFSRRNGDAN